jgi:integration host factor subunit beta
LIRNRAHCACLPKIIGNADESASWGNDAIAGMQNIRQGAFGYDQKRDSNNLLTRKDSEIIVDIVFDSIRNALKSGEKVEIRGFGSFTVRQRGPREARNPKSGEIVRIPEKKTPFFKTGKELKDRVNHS